MTQDSRYVDGGEPVYTERVVETTQYAQPTYSAPVVEAVEPVRRHPGLIPLLLSSLLGLLSLFLPFARFHQAFTSTRLVNGVARAYTVDEASRGFSFWNIANGHHHWILILLLLAAILALVAAFAGGGAVWARYLAGVLGIGTGIWLLTEALAFFSHSGLHNFFGAGLTGATGITGGVGRWIMALAGLALLATGIWSLLRGAADRVGDAVATGTSYNN